MPNTAIILPWVDLSEPMSIGPVTILPKAEALAAVDDDQRPTLRGLLDSFVHSPPSRLVNDASAEPPDSTACAVLVDYYGDDEDTLEIDQALAAIHALMFATIAENRYGASANGAVFEYEVHSKLELGFAVNVRHHMEGWSFNGFVPGRDRVKPWYVGKFHHSGRQKGKPFADALFRWWQAEPAHVDALFRVLRAATSESPDVEPGVVFALYAKAMAIAASAPGDKDRMEDLAPRVRALVAQHLGDPTVSGDFSYRVEQAWDATRQARNSGVHLNKFRHTRYDFETGGATLEHIAFRTVYALVVARLARDGHLDASDRSSDLLASDVAATESWLEMLSGPPDDRRPGQKWTKARLAAQSACLKAKFLASGVNPFASSA